MWQDYQDWLENVDTTLFYRVTLGGGTLLLLLSAWLWWSYVSINPQRVFWGTVNNNLVTTSVTKHLASSSDTSKLNQTERISLGSQNAITSVSTLAQTQDSQTTTVTTESIATPAVSFARYTAISTTQKAPNGKALSFTPVLGQWGKATASSGNGAFAQAIFDIVPFSYLKAQQRATIVQSMKQANLYSIDYSKLKKHSQNGHLIYDYAVTISPDTYINILKQIDAAMNLNQLAKLDVSQYEGSAPVAITISIDAHARQLTGLSYAGSNQTESFTDYGLRQAITLPTHTVDQASLQTKLASILNSQ